MSVTMTCRGQPFHLIDVDPDAIDIYDIAKQLSQQCRFGGALERFYSVAQHSVFVSYLCDPDHALVGLLHDAAEAYIGDIKKPLKNLLEPTITEIETPILQAIFDKYKADCSAQHLPVDVKMADEFACELERYSFSPQSTFWKTPKHIKEYGKIQSLGMEHAEELFIERFKELGG